MISKDLMNLIYAYNEHGIYFEFNSILWWFNGKRFEKWCRCQDVFRICVYGGKIYGHNACEKKTEPLLHKMYILENQQFRQFELMKTSNPYYICLDDNGNKYTYRNGKLSKNGKSFPNTTHGVYGFKLLYYDGFLYFLIRLE